GGRVRMGVSGRRGEGALDGGCGLPGRRETRGRGPRRRGRRRRRDRGTGHLAPELARRRDRDRRGVPPRARRRPARRRRRPRRGASGPRSARRWLVMSMPFYVSPEQLMKDRADFARKGIARGRSVIVLAYDEGIAFAT